MNMFLSQDSIGFLLDIITTAVFIVLDLVGQLV